MSCFAWDPTSHDCSIKLQSVLELGIRERRGPGARMGCSMAARSLRKPHVNTCMPDNVSHCAVRNDDDKPVIGCGREWYQDIIILPAQ
jgi:hypothetical protein